MTSQQAHPKNEQQLETHIEVVRPNVATPPSDNPPWQRPAPPSTSKHPLGLEHQATLSQDYGCSHEETQAATHHPRMVAAATQMKYQRDHHPKAPRGKECKDMKKCTNKQTTQRFIIYSKSH